MTTILESTAGDTWVEQVSNIIVQPIFTLILTCLTFLGFVYQLYSKKSMQLVLSPHYHYLFYFWDFNQEMSICILS